MIIVVQRCLKAKVTVNSEIISQIKSGLMLLVGINKGDEFLDADKVVDKIINLRIFNDEKDKMNLFLDYQKKIFKSLKVLEKKKDNKDSFKTNKF